MSPTGSVPSSMSSVVRKWSQALTGAIHAQSALIWATTKTRYIATSTPATIPDARPRLSVTTASSVVTPAIAHPNSHDRIPASANRPRSNSAPTSSPDHPHAADGRDREHGHGDRLADDGGGEVPDPRHGRRQRQVQEPAVEVRGHARPEEQRRTAAMIGHSQHEM